MITSLFDLMLLCEATWISLHIWQIVKKLVELIKYTVEVVRSCSLFDFKRFEISACGLVGSAMHCESHQLNALFAGAVKPGY